MCSIFTIAASLTQLLEQYHAAPSADLAEYSLPDRIYPKMYAPVVLAADTGTVLAPLHYSLIPHWSRDLSASGKYATFNARIETVHEKPAFRSAFRSCRCLVPISTFSESIYSGEHGGWVLRFSETAGRILTAAGIYDSWRGPDGAVLRSFAIITASAEGVILEAGHERSPVFLDGAGQSEWLCGGSRTAKELQEILAQRRAMPDWSFARERELAAGWEKRASRRARG